jgi:hypothetical protein
VGFNKPERESSGRRTPIVKSKVQGSSTAAGEMPAKRSPEVEAAGEEVSSRKRQRTDSTALIPTGEKLFPVEQVLPLSLSSYIAEFRVVRDIFAILPGS